jgi:membrane-bound lytic murein transglycosylase A
VRLSDGGLVRLAFDGRNGRPYTPIGKILAERGDIPADQISMQSVRAWLDAHPGEAKAVMDRNESYVFFRFAGDADTAFGPPGAMGVYLTAGRSAAVDKRFVPMGVPLFVDSTIPDGRIWQHLVLAQDLGSAIEGPARLDIFFGTGAPAASWAGRMRQRGTVYVLLPRP